MTLKFTARTIETIRAVPGRRIDVFDASLPGLALRVTPSGHKSWTVHYRNAARRLRRLTLGDYPTLSLAEARKAAQKALRAAVAGEDPATEKSAARLGETVDDLAREYIERHAKKHKRSWAEDQRKLNVDVLPVWRTLKVKDLTRRDVRTLIEAIADRGAPIAANRVLALVRKMLNFAVQRDWIDANPAALISKPGAERSRDRVLGDDELRLIWAACETEKPAMCALQRLRLVTVQRGGELAKLRWDDVDLTAGWIALPGTITKNKRPHRVPLSRLALDIFATVPRASDEWVFPGLTGRHPRRDVTRGAQRIGACVLERLRDLDPNVAVFDFKGHDLRRTASTKMAENGIAQADIARVLNHSEGGPRVTQVYNRYEYDKEKRAALDAWARTLVGIIKGRRRTAILPFAQAR
jgi:integrase